LLILASACWALGGCTDDARPPPAGGLPPAPSDEEPGLAPDTEPTPNIESPCGAASVALEFQRPNLYFALDASGSMLEDIPRGDSAAYPELSQPDDRYDALATAIETMLERIGHRTSYGAALFPSSDAVCDAGDEILSLQQGDTASFALAGERGPVLARLLSPNPRPTPSGATPVGMALSAIGPRLATALGPRYVFLLTDGGPNCNTELRCAIDSCIPNIERLRGSDGFRCNDEVNCCDDYFLGPGNCLDSGGSLEAVNELRALGIETYVIGMPGSDTYAGLLEELAAAGGTARSEPPAYYRVADAGQLIDTIAALGAKVGISCTVQLLAAPPDRDLVNVFFDGHVIEQDELDGWQWQDERTVQIVGPSCTLLETQQVLQVDVVAGCPVVIR
jgi:hypothetical protein